MQYIRSLIRKGFVLSAAAVVALSLPLATFSDVSADSRSDTGCAIPADKTYGAGTHSPTGSDAVAFVYQCPDPNNSAKQYVGKWLSERFVYDPVSQQTTPRDPVIYTYNDVTGAYDFSVWNYSPAAGGYKQVPGSTKTPPINSYSVIVGAPKPPAPSTPQGGGSAGTNTASAAVSPATGTANSTSSGETSGANLTNNTGVNVQNTTESTATSGNAAVIGNTTAGDATTGSALAQATIVNTLQTASNALGTGTNVATFTYNLDGDVNGDLLFDPAHISDVQGNSEIDNSLNNNLIVNNSTDASITNDIDLSAKSGDATVSNNTTGGNATTGPATTIANVVNSIQSIVTSGKSFIGTININGSLNGDILLPANLVDQLLAANVPKINVSVPDSINTYNSDTTNTATITNTNHLGITNNVTSAAKSGSAAVQTNTSGGNAKTGGANNNLVAFNLTGSNVVGTNDLLVFVNVLGTWTGLIVHAPAGATAASLGGGIVTKNTVANTADITNTTNETITNNITSEAQSGNAEVSRNTSGGNATSGNANTAVNLMNIQGSTINLSNWFGILFINVFGSWNGSFGIDTSAGSVANAATDGSGTLVGGTQFVRFVPGGGSGARASVSNTNEQTTQPSSTHDTEAVLAAHTEKPSTKEAPTIATTAPGQVHRNLWVPIIGSTVAILMLAAERIRSVRRPN